MAWLESQVCFNSSVGILSVGTRLRGQQKPGVHPFQFLSRNSVRWDQATPIVTFSSYRFQFLSRNSVRWDRVSVERSKNIRGVSIPQSEFCPLGLVVWLAAWRDVPGFQFLSRNSVRWDEEGGGGGGGGGGVSIPQSEFCPLGLKGNCNSQCLQGSFNSSVGILSVGTRIKIYPAFIKYHVSIPQSEFCPLGQNVIRSNQGHNGMFQFLSRNSVRWDREHCRRALRIGHLSFNSSVGILSVGTPQRPGKKESKNRLFQFLSRNSVRWDIINIIRPNAFSSSFNSSVGILSVGT